MLAKGRQFLFLMSSTIFLMVKSGKIKVVIEEKKSTTKEK
jgi:hypothetical protein